MINLLPKSKDRKGIEKFAGYLDRVIERMEDEGEKRYSSIQSMNDSRGIIYANELCSQLRACRIMRNKLYLCVEGLSPGKSVSERREKDTSNPNLLIRRLK